MKLEVNLQSRRDKKRIGTALHQHLFEGHSIVYCNLNSVLRYHFKSVRITWPDLSSFFSRPRESQKCFLLCIILVALWVLVGLAIGVGGTSEDQDVSTRSGKLGPSLDILNALFTIGAVTRFVFELVI